MKIKTIKANNFKRFSDLTITNIPESAKLVVLVGPNGSGKTSVFEIFNHWYKYRGFGAVGDMLYYLRRKNIENDIRGSWFDGRTSLEFYDLQNPQQDAIKGKFYFRTAYRNEPDFTIHNLNQQANPLEVIRHETLMTTDTTVSENYQRLVSKALDGIFHNKAPERKVDELKDELIAKINNSLTAVFDDLQLTSLGDPLVDGSFYFTKGNSENFHYKNLSAGEKSAFDLILDLIIKSTYFSDSIFCIDEPEDHMHTVLQGKLLHELYNLISKKSQLWIATHSIGMMNEAKELENDNHNSVIFLDFSDRNFDEKTIIEPSKIDASIWKKFLELAFGDFANLLAPKTLVFCEGTPLGRKYKNFDAQVYGKIFSNKYPDVTFVSCGSCSQIEDENNIGMKVISSVFHGSKIIKIVDRDNKSPQEVQECNDKGIKVLEKRHIECYLLDDEIITKLCKTLDKESKIQDCLEMKQNELSDLSRRDCAPDDVKSASPNICSSLARILGIVNGGGTKEAFMRDTLIPLITEDTQVYKDLERQIFDSKSIGI
ncbi:MAG: ATP-binding protein [Treponema sp.]|nr:ATP-binding protein [Treponema sp.]